MRKLIAVTLLAATVSAPALAWGDREQAALAGTILGYVIGQQQNQPRPYVHPAPVYQQPPVYVPGVVYRDFIHRPMYKAVDVYIPECNCTRTVMVQVN
jgi:hypothetical protein